MTCNKDCRVDSNVATVLQPCEMRDNHSATKALQNKKVLVISTVNQAQYLPQEIWLDKPVNGQNRGLDWRLKCFDIDVDRGCHILHRL